MADTKKIGMAVGTFGAALGIGFVMQNGDALASRFGAEAAPQNTAAFAEAANVDAATVEPEVTPTEQPVLLTKAGVVFSTEPAPAGPDLVVTTTALLPDVAKAPPQQAAPIHLASLDTEPTPEVESDVIVEAEKNCGPVMTAVAGEAATVLLSVSAPCHTASPFTVHHQGMMFTETTDVDGAADLIVPALAEVSVIIAAFAGGDGAVATAVIPDFASFDRAVLQWQGETSLMLSAYEGEAMFGDDNHIYAGNPGEITRLIAAEGGYLVRLGDGSLGDGLMAEIYTFPAGTMGDAPDVMLVAEAEITTANCGQELSAQSIQIAPSGQTSALDLTMTMPDCDAVGDFLILQNMFEDLTLASK